MAHAEPVILEAIQQRVFPSAVCAVLLGGRIRFQGAYGNPDPEADAPATAQTIYDLASLTKPLATTTLALLALEEGKLTLETPITRFFPNAKHLEGVQVKHLLTHTSGLPAWRALYKTASTREQVIEGVLNTPRTRPPGQGYAYSDLGYILMGAILEQVYERSLAELFREKVAEPLGLSATGYNPPADQHVRIAPTANSESRPNQVLRGEVHDENAHAMGGVAGHAGLFGTLEDLIRYARMVLGGGRPLLSYYSIQLLLTPQVQVGNQPLGMHTLGLFAHPNPLLPRGDLFPTRCVGHSGFTGTLLLFDPQVELAVILLTNHVYYSREKEAYLDYRRRILNALAAQVGVE
ncbi:MAG: serine hydrolase domain-containing protein [Armatimonadota bacterium]|nr:serine hydrolase domain-containing protein [Armatimonadota bacterium]